MTESTRYIEGYLEELRLVFGRANATIDAYYQDLGNLSAVLENLGSNLLSADSRVIGIAIDQLGSRLATTSLVRLISVARGFYRYLLNIGAINLSPLEGLEVPKAPLYFPEVLEIHEVEALLDVINLGTDYGVRDRAMLELAYGSGLRASEVIGANVDDLDLEEALARVRGKGDKFRIVPLTPLSVSMLRRYIYEGARSNLEGHSRSSALFYSSRSKRISRQALWQIVKKYALLAGIRTSIHPHTLRHSCATHMVAGGADIRSVQELLGHSSITTTQIYTHITPTRLLEVYRASHPRA